MTDALLISEATIKKYCVIENNVDPKLIEATIVMVQDIQLQQVIGTALYNKLLTDCPTFTGVYSTLMDNYIIPFLMNAVIADGCTTFLYRFSNKGPVTSNSENDSPISEAQVNRIEAKWRAQADFYGKRLSLYLDQNYSSFPELATNDEMQQLSPKTKRYATGINLSNPRKRNGPNHCCKD